MILFLLKRITPSWVLKAYHFVLAILGHALYGFPSKKLVVIGVTGTNGKTTTSFALAHILQKAGFRIAVSSSAQFQVGDNIEPNPFMVSMPGRFKLAKFLSDAVRAQCAVAIVESTSEGTLQYRHRFIAYDYFVVTNLRPEHIERHGSFENYKRAKLELVKRMVKSKKPGSRFPSLVRNKGIVVNLDDEYANEFLDAAGDIRKIGVAFTENGMNKKAVGVEEYECSWMNGKITFNTINYKLQVPGLFNAYNIVIAAGAATFIGIPFEKALEFASDFGGVPGRFEIFRKGNIVIIVDYAHEPYSLETVLSVAKETFRGMKLIHVFGAPSGGRDVRKRPPMGKVSDEFADRIILTNDDPYDEDPLSIIDQIKSGIQHMDKVETVLDRASAIRKGVEYARANGGVVVVTGKGTETEQCFERGRKIPWSDREVVHTLLHSV